MLIGLAFQSTLNTLLKQNQVWLLHKQTSKASVTSPENPFPPAALLPLVCPTLKNAPQASDCWLKVKGGGLQHHQPSFLCYFMDTLSSANISAVASSPAVSGTPLLYLPTPLSLAPNPVHHPPASPLAPPIASQEVPPSCLPIHALSLSLLLHFHGQSSSHPTKLVLSLSSAQFHKTSCSFLLSPVAWVSALLWSSSVDSGGFHTHLAGLANPWYATSPLAWFWWLPSGILHMTPFPLHCFPCCCRSLAHSPWPLYPPPSWVESPVLAGGIMGSSVPVGPGSDRFYFRLGQQRKPNIWKGCVPL